MRSLNGSYSSKHENDRVAFREIDTAKCSADRRGSPQSARTVSELPTTRSVTRPVNTRRLAVPSGWNFLRPDLWSASVGVSSYP